MQKLRIGVVGAGYISRTYHCPALKKLKRKYPALELAAICDIREEAAREAGAQFGFARTYNNLAAMLEAEELEGVYLLIMPDGMKEAALACIRRGIPLLLEKPPGNNSAEVAELAEAAERRGVPTVVALNRRFMPLVQRARELSLSRERRPQLILAQMLRFERREAEFAYGTGVHAIDVMRFLGGEVTGVRTEKLMLAGNRSAAYFVEFDYASGVQGRLTILPETGVEAERYQIHGNDWSLLLDAPLDWTVDYPGKLTYFEGRRNFFVQDNSLWPETMRDNIAITGFLGESEHFLECLTAGAAPSPSLRDCLRSMQIAEAVLAGKNIEFK